jgi:hypothetical protein
LTRRRTVTSLALATAIALAGVLCGVLAGGVKAAAPAEAPASPTARAQLAAQSAQAAATLATLPHGSVRITLPGHPPLELSEDPQLIATIEKTSGISLKHH